MNDIIDIIPIWQPQGYSTNHLAKKIGELYEVKATHTGTLDPMAEGVIIVLAGENRLKRQELSSMIKGYEFEILFGIKTDSFDGMGFVTETNLDKSSVSHEKLTDICKSFIGNYEQTVPIFSAQLYKGKKLFEWGHEKVDVPLPIKKGEIYKLEIKDLISIPLNEAINSVVSKINNISGEFRQKPIIEGWNNFMLENNTNNQVIIAKFYIEMSRGLYVRSLSQDICDRINKIGFVYSLIRVRNGNYFKNDCKSLVDLFGSNYANILG